MYFLQSLGYLLLGILKRIYWLLPALLTDPFDVLERLGMPLDIPTYISWSLLGLGLFIAILLTFHELRTKYGMLQQEFKQQEWDCRRTQNIKLREPYLKEIVPALNNLDRVINDAVDTADYILSNNAMLQDSTDYIMKEVGGLAGITNQSEEAQLKFAVEITNILNAQHIGIEILKERSIECKEAEKTLDELRNNITDTLLCKMLVNYISHIYGNASFELWSRYLHQSQKNRSLSDEAKTFGGKFSRRQLQKVRLSKISRRIEQLLLGDEAK